MSRKITVVLASLCLSLAVAASVPLSAQMNVTEIGNLHNYPWNSDIWGYSDGVYEIAIVGHRTGTSFINATDPANPVELTFIPGPSSTWRDIKTYSSYAYISNETGDGVQIVDLSNPLVPTLVKSDSTWFSTAHNVFADTANALMYFPGSNAPGTVVLDVSDPVNPVFAGNFDDSYVHDIYAEDGFAYTGMVYNGQLGVLDVSNPDSIFQTDAITTAGAFTHNTWLTQDGNYCLTTDENSGGHIQIYDVQDPYNVFLVSEWVNHDDPLSIVHNATVLGDHAFVSWYRAGLQILDVQDPRFPQRVGYFDTYSGVGSGFQGAWGVYPYSPSGVIYVSDINTGFYTFEFVPDYGWIQGTVTDSVSSDSLSGVQCTIVSENNTVYTVDSGFYQFSLPAGVYDVFYSAFGYEPDSLTIVVADSAVSNGDIELVPLPMGEVRGYVGEYGAYLPLENVLVTLDGSPLETTTDSQGHYVFEDVPADNYSVSVDPFGYAPETTPVTVTLGQASHVNFALTAAVFMDDLETNPTTWTVGAPGDGATTGIWELADPQPTGGGVVQPDDDHTPSPGVQCFVTGASGGEGSSVGADDVDGGATSLISPIVDLSGVTDPVISYYRWYLNNAGSNPGSDAFVAYVSSDAGSTWVQMDSTTVSNNSWVSLQHDIGSLITPTSQTRFMFKASDFGGGSIVEALIDDVEILGTGAVVSVPDQNQPARMLPATPNPFRHSTAVRFSLEQKGRVRVDVFSLAGRKVATLHDGVLPSGSHMVPWEGRNDRGQDVAGGVYFIRLSHENGSSRQKVILTR